MCDGELEYDSGADCAVVCPEHGEIAIKHVCEEWLKELTAERDALLRLTDQQDKSITILQRRIKDTGERYTDAESNLMDIQGED
jgi:hypothetical protein